MVKRLEDLVIAGFMLLVTSPFFLIIAFLIWNTDKGPVFYTQERLTLDGKVFRIYKFRTMIVDAEKKSGPVKAGEKDCLLYTSIFARILSGNGFFDAYFVW